MQAVHKRDLGIPVAALLLISLACKAISFGEQDIEATIQAGIAETQASQTDAVLDEIPQPNTGETITAGVLEVFIPPEFQGNQPSITAEVVTDPLPPAPAQSSAVGQAYEITSEEELSGPVLISISYDPTELAPGTNENNLYIATLVGEEWQAVPDGFVDTENHTVYASVEHFSFFGIFESAASAVYDAVQSAIGDEITSEYFGDLPDQIRYNFYDLQIKPQDVTAVVHAKLSLATKTASGVISFGNLVSKTAGLAIGALEEGYEDLAWAMGELVFAEVGDYATDSTAGSFIVAAYDSFDLGLEIGEYIVDLKNADPSTAAVKASAWILAREMEYINENMDPAFKDLWKFNTLSGSRLDVYAVYFDAVPWKEELGLGASGVKFYYYDESSGEWVNYFNDVFVWKMTFEPQTGEESSQEAQKAPKKSEPTKTKKTLSTTTSTPTNTPKPTSTPRPTNTPKPTNTPVPTSTPFPTSTPYPTDTPIPRFGLEVTIRWFNRAGFDYEFSTPSGAGSYEVDLDRDNFGPGTCEEHTVTDPHIYIHFPNYDAVPGEYSVWAYYWAGYCANYEDAYFEIEVHKDGELIEFFSGTLTDQGETWFQRFTFWVDG